MLDLADCTILNLVEGVQVMEGGRPGQQCTLWLLTAQLLVSNPRSIFVPSSSLTAFSCLALVMGGLTLNSQTPGLPAVQHMLTLCLCAEDQDVGVEHVLHC